MDSFQQFFREVPAIGRPIRLFLEFLVVTFVVEYGLMLLLPHLFAESWSGLPAFMDAGVLTLVLGSLVWVRFLVPLQQHSHVRARLFGWLLETQEQERSRIARDLHDGLGQTLTGLVFGLKWIEETPGYGPAQDCAKTLRNQAKCSLEDLRRLVRGLRTVVLEDLGLEATLQKLTHDNEEFMGIKVGLEFYQGGKRWSAELETGIYRIILEALTNAQKHGKGTRVDILVEAAGDQAKVLISDNGGGFDPKVVMSECIGEGSFGLWSMKERAGLLGGTFHIKSSPGKGCTIEVYLPILEKNSSKVEN